MAKLQLALDTLPLDGALELLEKVVPYIDIAEVGTPLVYRSGLEAIRQIRRAHPGLEILCDGKIMDAGAYESGEMFEAGANVVSVLAVTDDATIRACVEEAKRWGGQVSVDMICAHPQGGRAAEVEALGADLVSVHTGVDQQARGRTPLDDFREIRPCLRSAQISIAGGIKLETVETYLAEGPDVVIVGGGILSQPDPAEAARRIKERMNEFERSRV